MYELIFFLYFISYTRLFITVTITATNKNMNTIIYTLWFPGSINVIVS